MDIKKLIQEIKDIRNPLVRLIERNVPNPVTDEYIKQEARTTHGIHVQWNEFNNDLQVFKDEQKTAGKTPAQIEEMLKPVHAAADEMYVSTTTANKAHPDKIKFLKANVSRGMFLQFGKDWDSIKPTGPTYNAFRYDVIGNSSKAGFFDRFVNKGDALIANGVTVSSAASASQAASAAATKTGGSVSTTALDEAFFNKVKFFEGQKKANEHSAEFKAFIIAAKENLAEFGTEAKKYVEEMYKNLTGSGAVAGAGVAAGAGTTGSAASASVPAIKPDPEMLNILKDIGDLQYEMISLIVTDMHPVAEKSRKVEKQAKNDYIADEVGQAHRVYTMWSNVKARQQEFKDKLIASGKSESEIIAALAPLERAHSNMEMDVANANKAHPEKIQFIKNYLDKGMTLRTQDKHWHKQPGYTEFYNDVTGKNTNNSGLFDYWVDQGNARISKGGKIINPLSGQSTEAASAGAGATGGATGAGVVGATGGAAGAGTGGAGDAAEPVEGDWWGKTKQWFSKLPGAGMAGGAVGAILGYMGGKIFGDGIIGNIFSIVFALVGGIFGAKFAGERWGGNTSNTTVGGQTQPGYGQGGPGLQNNQNNGKGASGQQQYDPYPAVPGFGWPQPYPQFGCFPNMQYAVTQYHQNANYGGFDVRDHGAGNNFGSPNVNQNGNPRGGNPRGNHRGG